MAQANKKTPAKTGKEKGVSLVYIGPNMGRDLLMTQFSTFKNGLPLPVKEQFDSDKEFKALFVPVADLGSARAKLADPGSRLARAFRAIVQRYILIKKEA
ncbi:MAG: hypothetical protein JEZ12_24895 [Desulfobacterium sp.]|nr:hypothetical protein [Desulfobacterium sp.]